MSIASALVTATVIAASAISPADPAWATPVVEHCAVEVIASADESVSGEDIVCFATEAERDGYVSAQTLTQRRAGSGSVKLGTAYKGTNLTGSSLAFWGTGTCAGTTYGFASLASDWVTGMRSITGAGCSVRVYSAANYGGNSVTCTPTCNALGSVVGTARSLIFRPL
ncbi:MULTISPECIES: hypothetical protein [Microbacterium]|uniref:hypothetical protein n=1 Tax=Microbacterium TaxID=33882 RepID=UPI001E33F203|nr:hypothetical protein [Microbacterium nymphoidis]MCD2500065.1 hypothetical protein [Microbacterium nymphoidis]